MFTESVIVENEEKFIVISKNNKKITGAACTRAVVKDNLTRRQIIVWLNGHIIIDTGIVEKIDNWGWTVLPIEASRQKIHNILTLFGHTLKVKKVLLSDDDNEYSCSCGNWRFYDKFNVTEYFLTHVEAIRPLMMNDILPVPVDYSKMVN